MVVGCSISFRQLPWQGHSAAQLNLSSLENSTHSVQTRQSLSLPVNINRVNPRIFSTFGK